MLSVADPVVFAAVMTVFGLLVGSFANVVIWRLPRGESLVHPPSRCPRCEAPVRWFDNIPVLSWMALRGRCRDCGSPIASRYPVVEAASGTLWLTAAIVWGPGPQAVVAATFFWSLLVLSCIDLDTMRLPNPLVGALALLGLVAALVSQLTPLPLAPLVDTRAVGPLASAFLGVALGAGLPWAVAALYRVIRGRTGFGMGDVKLLGAMGLFLGPYVLLALAVASVVGAVVGILLAARSGSSIATKRIPFGPFLALGGVVTAIGGEWAIAAYLRAVGL